MKIGQAFPSKYLGAPDFDDGDRTLTIESSDIESVGRGDDQEDKLVLYFVDEKKGLVMNKTNAKAIAALLGSDDTDDWVGHEITLFATECTFGSDTVPCVRVRTKSKAKPAGKPTAPSKAPPKPAPKGKKPESEVEVGDDWQP